MAMTQTDVDQLLNQAKVTLTGVSEAGLKGAFYDVLSEFLNDSSCWTQDVFINAIADTQVYDLFVNEGRILRLVNVVDVGTTIPALGTVPSEITPIAALMIDVGVLTLKNAPQESRVYCATVVTNVALPVDKKGLPQAPEWLLPIWHVGLLDGLLGKMMLQPEKPYSSTAAATYHLRRFRDAIGRARVSKLRANTNGSQAWAVPQSFRSTGQQGGVPGAGSNERSF